MSVLPHVVRAEYRGAYRIYLAFHDGREKPVDFAPWLQGPAFEPLKDRAYFQRFFLDAGTVSWPTALTSLPKPSTARRKWKRRPI